MTAQVSCSHVSPCVLLERALRGICLCRGNYSWWFPEGRTEGEVGVSGEPSLSREEPPFTVVAGGQRGNPTIRTVMNIELKGAREIVQGIRHVPGMHLTPLNLRPHTVP